jgi:pyruvate kinase
MKTRIIPSLSYEHEFEKKVDIISKMNVDMVRINFGRGSVEHNLESISFIHKNYPNMHIALDLPGNKKRINSLIDADIKKKSQERFSILIRDKSVCQQPSNQLKISLTDWDYKIVKDDIILFGDSDLIAQVIEVDKEVISLLALKDGKIKSKSGLLIKEKYKANSTISDIERYIASETSCYVNEIFLSFADTAERINLCRAIYPKQRIISKIETPYAMNNIDSISNVSDGLMLARGDLQNYFNFDEINNETLNVLYNKVKEDNKLLYVATNYFRSVINNNSLSEKELLILYKTLSYSPKYILLNETCYSDDWLKVCKVAQSEINKYFS